MSHAYTSALFHVTFSTKNREPLITDGLRERLWAYLGGIAREHQMTALTIGGVENHVHLLVALPAVLAVAKAVQLLKGGSSKWVHETFPAQTGFAWQEGYGAFSVSVSVKDATAAYIHNQREHHRKVTFEEEFIAFLKKHGIEYDPRYVWG